MRFWKMVTAHVELEGLEAVLIVDPGNYAVETLDMPLFLLVAVTTKLFTVMEDGLVQ
jgi:hypothetical protein